MSKAVLLSIRPKWCELIASGEKSIEVRKTRPKQETPFKCYIYCTKPSFPHEDFFVFDAGTDKAKAFYGGGKVIGEFVCDRIFPIEPLKKEPPNLGGKRTEEYSKLGYRDCLTDEDFAKYVGLHNGKTMCGWHISNLVIYDEPKKLSEFHRVCPESLYCESCAMWSEQRGCGNAALQISHPPESWRYVEELP
jgi:predicted transcriptional regulator